MWHPPGNSQYPTESIIGLLKLFGNLGVPFNDIGHELYRCYSKLSSSRLPIAQYLEETAADFDPAIVTFLMTWCPDTASDLTWARIDRAHPGQTLLCERLYTDYAERKSFVA